MCHRDTTSEWTLSKASISDTAESGDVWMAIKTKSAVAGNGGHRVMLQSWRGSP